MMLKDSHLLPMRGRGAHFFSMAKSGDPSLVLRSIESRDQETLRTWKNRNREYFFFQGIISPAMQREWFAQYRKDVRNHLFIVEYNGQTIGCMGFKTLSEGADIYNVILGNPLFARRGIMSGGLKIMCSYILELGIRRIFLKVLKNNQVAFSWYLKNGFEHQFSKDNFEFLELALDRFERQALTFGSGKVDA